MDNLILFSQPLAKSRPQPRVLVPLRGPVASGFSSQPTIMSSFQQAQQKTSVLAAPAKGAQAFISSAGQKKTDSSTTPLPAPQCPTTLTRVAPVQNSKFLNV